LQSNAYNVESTTEDGQVYDPNVYPQVQPKTIGPGQSISLNLTPLLGILRANKYLPLRMLGMQLEFTLANASEALHPNSASQQYQIEQAQMRMSVVRLDSALENSFNSLLLSGRSISWSVRTLHLQQAALPNGSTEVQVSMVRALSRLAAIFVTFAGAPTYLDAAGNTLATPANLRHLHKSFLNPTAFINGNPIGTADESLLQWQLQIGPKNYPEASPASNLAETFSLLRQTMGTYDETLRTSSITEAGYRQNQFVIGVPLSVVPGASFSGLNTRSGDLLVFRATNLDPGIRAPGRCFVHMVSEQIIELRESGVSILD
jgi:hypothetical protein